MDLAPERLPFPPQQAWNPLRSEEWTPDAARHLLSRTGWSASQSEVSAIHAAGLPTALDRLFPVEPLAFPRPDAINRWIELARDATARRRRASPAERRRSQQEVRDEARSAIQQLALDWLQVARDPRRAAFEKWLLFVSDVYVVGMDKVQDAAALFAHHDLLRQHALGRAPALTKAVSRSPGMVLYLDLQTSRREAPNENFARELFELFVLGQGNYTEQDIKEAARAFTGYRQRLGTFMALPRQFDDGPKTVFGQRGCWTGDDVIDLAYEQPSAAHFLPTEMLRFYLDLDPLPAAWMQPLADHWRTSGFELRELLHRFFGSRLFFATALRGAAIKSPIHLYLGLLQELELDVRPVPRLTLVPLRQLGQSLFAPPNVRGWVGGRQWINSATLAARRRLVEQLFTPLDTDRLDADEARALRDREAQGPARWSVTREQLEPWAHLEPEDAAEKIVQTFLAGSASASVRQTIAAHLRAEYGRGRDHSDTFRDVVVALMQSPAYQLC